MLSPTVSLPPVPPSIPVKTTRTRAHTHTVHVDGPTEDDIVKKLAKSHESDALRAYCRDMAKYDLITPAQEVELAVRIKA